MGTISYHVHRGMYKKLLYNIYVPQCKERKVRSFCHLLLACKEITSSFISYTCMHVVIHRFWPLRQIYNHLDISFYWHFHFEIFSIDAWYTCISITYWQIYCTSNRIAVPLLVQQFYYNVAHNRGLNALIHILYLPYL